MKNYASQARKKLDIGFSLVYHRQVHDRMFHKVIEMENERKESRRVSYKNKKRKLHDKDFILDKKEKYETKKNMKIKRQEMEQEELWEQWENEIY